MTQAPPATPASAGVTDVGRTRPPATRFTRIRARLEAAAPERGMPAFLYEFLLFGFKQGWACLFGALMLALLLGTHLWWPANAPVARYDFLTVAALLIQIAMLAFRLESWEEAKVILAFHVVGTVMELFKTAHGSWEYREAGILRIGDVPLFSGFMYAAVGSYLARVWRIFDFRFSRYPPRWATVALAIAVYVNFFAHHWLPDIRLALFAATALLFARTWVHFRPVPRPSPDAAAARLPAGRAVHLVRREYRHLRQCLELPRTRRRSGRWCRSASCAPGIC